MYETQEDAIKSLCGKGAKSSVFNANKYKWRGKTRHMHNPSDEQNQKNLVSAKNSWENNSHSQERKNTNAISSQAARLNFASSVAMMNFDVKQILLFASERNAPPSLGPFLASSAILSTFD